MFWAAAVGAGQRVDGQSWRTGHVRVVRPGIPVELDRHVIGQNSGLRQPALRGDQQMRRGLRNRRHRHAGLRGGGQRLLKRQERPGQPGGRRQIVHRGAARAGLLVGRGGGQVVGAHRVLDGDPGGVALGGAAITRRRRRAGDGPRAGRSARARGDQHHLRVGGARLESEDPRGPGKTGYPTGAPDPAYMDVTAVFMLTASVSATAVFTYWRQFATATSVFWRLPARWPIGG